MGLQASHQTKTVEAKRGKGAPASTKQPQGSSASIHPVLRLQKTIGNQAVQRLLKSRGIQAKLEISQPGDFYEQEADRVSANVMRMEGADLAHMAQPAIRRLNSGVREELSAKHIQRICTECEEEPLQRKAALRSADLATGQVMDQVDAKVHAVSSGQPLTNEQRSFFEPRFGADFSHVRIHTDRSADSAARAVNALAFTRGRDIVFRNDQYRPHTLAGRQILAHELTHVVQQGAAPSIKYRSMNGYGQQHVQKSEMHMGAANHMVQRLPGDGMLPPGDCSWANYIRLRGSVETAKAVVNILGACSAGDNCLLLATKIAAITAEIAARVALDTTCFRGGDAGHREQVQAKVNMMNRCYQFFTNSNCSPELIARMAAVVELVREKIATAAVVVAIALIVALILAIIALAEEIAALIAAAAEAAALALATASIIALLVRIKDQLASEDSSGA